VLFLLFPRRRCLAAGVAETCSEGELPTSVVEAGISIAARLEAEPPCGSVSRLSAVSRWLFTCSKDRASPVTNERSLAHNVPMPDAQGHSPPSDNRGLWQRQVQLSRGHWRREDAAGPMRSAGWWESVTWSPAAGTIVLVLADVAVTSARCLLQRRRHRLLVASLLRRQLVSAGRNFPRLGRTP
jgi:hypothetical protein